MSRSIHHPKIIANIISCRENFGYFFKSSAIPVLAVFEPTRVERWRALVKVNWRVYRETGEVPGLTGYGISGWTNFSQEFNPEMRR
jgi:hypothetical protein